MWRSGAALVLAATLVACGGGGGDSGTGAGVDSPRGALQTAEISGCRTVRVQLFGDSTQYGQDGRTGTRASTTPGSALQAAMDARFGAGRVAVETRAVGGSTSTRLRDGTDGLNQAWPGSVDADIVVVNHGINDALQGLPLETYADNLRALGTAPAARVLFETPNPVHDVPASTTAYAQRMRDVAAERALPLIDTEAFVLAQANWRALVPDGLHPTAALYARIGAGPLADAVGGEVAALGCR